jgi:murein DD-endopeptidase MepM/ murein hydrolase activator NlpD
MHAGIDFKAHHDTVFAILDGFVKSAGYNKSLGLNTCLQHSANLQSIYGHLSQLLVGPKVYIHCGEPIGITGATGRVTGEHLHFSICYVRKYINPIQFLYELLIKNENEQKFQSTADSACGQADRRN